jgi:predicted DNA-binding helix-hairpin-helix protein
MRFYGFQASEITSAANPNLDLRIDPKLGWALRNRHLFPLDINKAPRHMLLRVPGLGTRNVERILQARRWSSIRLSDLVRLRVPLKKVLPFITASDHRPPANELEDEGLITRFLMPPVQLEFFGQADTSARDGQL